MSLRLRIACRPILGLLIRGQPIPTETPHAYLIKHDRLGLWLINPWPDNNDPRRNWGEIRRAYRFHSEQYATATINDQRLAGQVIRLPLQQL